VTRLDLSGSPMSHGKQITNLKPLAGLTGLRTLNLCLNQITDLTPLAGWTRLYSLTQSGCSHRHSAT
jgi:Leucine-rich repeat (LRR) protein